MLCDRLDQNLWGYCWSYSVVSRSLFTVFKRFLMQSIKSQLKNEPAQCKYCLDLVQHPYPFLKLISTLGVFALGALLSGSYCERCLTNLEIRYEVHIQKTFWSIVTFWGLHCILARNLVQDLCSTYVLSMYVCAP